MASSIVHSSPIGLKRKGFRIRKTYNINPYKVEVEFVDGLSTQEVVSQISNLANPQVILWYIGCRGFREGCAHFYRDSLISPLLKCSEASFWLVDLTAWGAFRNPKCSISQESGCCEIIDLFLPSRIKCVKSAKILSKIHAIKEKQLVGCLKNALKRNYISELSKDFPNANILVKDIFPEKCPVISDWYNKDTSKAYSAFQYLEGCLLVDELFIELVSKQKERSDIEIVFALPNDEIKYYADLENSFQRDLSFLISGRCAQFNIQNINLKIKFLSFRYGSQARERPYNAPGKVMNKNGITSNVVLGVDKSQSIIREVKPLKKQKFKTFGEKYGD